MSELPKKWVNRFHLGIAGTRVVGALKAIKDSIMTPADKELMTRIEALTVSSTFYLH